MRQRGEKEEEAWGAEARGRGREVRGEKKADLSYAGAFPKCPNVSKQLGLGQPEVRSQTKPSLWAQGL